MPTSPTAEMLGTIRLHPQLDRDHVVEAIDACPACAQSCGTCAEACHRCEGACMDLLGAMKSA